MKKSWNFLGGMGVRNKKPYVVGGHMDRSVLPQGGTQGYWAFCV